MNSFVQLKIIRNANKLTQDQVAEALGITRSAYCGYEIGRRKMGTEMLETLAKFYGIPITCFFTSDASVVRENDSGCNKIYLSTLSKDERDLIARFRCLSAEEKEQLKVSLDLKADNGDKK